MSDEPRPAPTGPRALGRPASTHDVFVGVVELRQGEGVLEMLTAALAEMAPLAHEAGLVSEVVAVVRDRYLVDVLRWRANDPGALDRAMANPQFRELHDAMLEACVEPESRRDFSGHIVFRTGEV